MGVDREKTLRGGGWRGAGTGDEGADGSRRLPQASASFAVYQLLSVMEPSSLADVRSEESRLHSGKYPSQFHDRL